MSLSVYLPALKDVRVAKGFTQEALAAASFKTTKTISRIENGEPTTIETAKQLAKALELKSFAQLQSIQSTGLIKQFFNELYSIVLNALRAAIIYLPFFIFFNLCVSVESSAQGDFDMPITLGMVWESAGQCIIPLFTFNLGYSSYRFASSYLGEHYFSAFNAWVSSSTKLKYVSATNVILGLCSSCTGILVPFVSSANAVMGMDVIPLLLLSIVYIAAVVSYSFLFARFITVCNSMRKGLYLKAKP